MLQGSENRSIALCDPPVKSRVCGGSEPGWVAFERTSGVVRSSVTPR
ncbi:MAG TPA: hypothetical protein VER33_28930 [Polyangiaceae bacterium]|nr:hypothetical protein [Polyangiaceae bacterium]